MQKNEKSAKRYLNVDEVSEELGVSRNRVYVLCKQKDFPSVRVSPRRIVIPADSLAEWMQNQINMKR